MKAAIDTEWRELELADILLPVEVRHGHLNPLERVDRAERRVDILKVQTRLRYLPGDRALIWSEIFEDISGKEIPSVEGPLESLLDNFLNVLELRAHSQGISLLEISAAAERIGLVSGAVVLSRERILNVFGTERPRGSRAGVSGIPLMLSLENASQTREDRSEGPAGETLLVSFSVDTGAGSLAERDLAGVYNYAEVLTRIHELGGRLFRGSMEDMCAMISRWGEESAKAQGFKSGMAFAEVIREGYAKVRPLFRSSRHWR